MDICNHHLFGLIIILAVLVIGIISTIIDKKEREIK
tara:strand:+ start:272 stop:379 length:108 start_codon:yes stop_codon:yes gene_type:complete